MISLTEVLIFLHVIFFVYWLGADLGVYYASRFVVNSELSVDARGVAGKIMDFVDLSPRICLVLILPTGVSLMATNNKGATFLSPTLAIAVWIFAFIWLYLVIKNYTAHGDPKVAFLRKIDLAIRYILVVGLIGTSLYVLFASEPFGVTTNPKWLALKVILYSVAIFGGIQIRRALVSFTPAYVKIMSGNSDEASESALKLSLKRSIPWVHLIWLCVAIAAFLGIAKPGAHL